MLHTTFQGHRPFGSGEEDFVRFLPYMDMSAVLVMWPGPFEQTFRSTVPRRLHMKFGFSRLSGFRGEDVWKRWQHTYIHILTYIRTTVAYLYYKLTNEPKGSDELIIYTASHIRGHFIWDLWNEPLVSFINFIWTDHECNILFITWPFWIEVNRFLSKHDFNRKRHVVMDVVMTLHVRAKVLCNVWSRHFYDMTLSTEWQRRHMINIINYMDTYYSYRNSIKLSQTKSKECNPSCFPISLQNSILACLSRKY